jgi:hypothetical protein
VNIRKVSSEKELRKIGRPGLAEDVPPTGISPVLRASWKFARDTAKRFNAQLLNDHTKQFLDRLAKKF